MKRPQVTRRVARHTTAALAMTAFLATLAGCAADPALSPHEKMPSAQEVADKLHLSAGDTGATAPTASGANAWWTVYKDPELSHWIELGLRESPDLRVAARKASACCRRAPANRPR